MIPDRGEAEETFAEIRALIDELRDAEAALRQAADRAFPEDQS